MPMIAIGSRDALAGLSEEVATIDGSGFARSAFALGAGAACGPTGDACCVSTVRRLAYQTFAFGDVNDQNDVTRTKRDR